MKFLLVATFKSHKLGSDITAWIEKIAPLAGNTPAQVVVAPSFPYLASAKNPHIALAAQDVSPFPLGSYTGAVNAEQLRDNGVTYCLIGHSERRRYFHETNNEIANKASELLKVGITPILCLAESDVVPQLAALEEDEIAKIIFCYEPPGDIGGTETAPVDAIAQVLARIKQVAERPVRVMYGGSVNAANLAPLLTLGIDGVLVSTASLDAHSFGEIIHAFGKAEKK